MLVTRMCEHAWINRAEANQGSGVARSEGWMDANTDGNLKSYTFFFFVAQMCFSCLACVLVLPMERLKETQLMKNLRRESKIYSHGFTVAKSSLFKEFPES